MTAILGDGLEEIRAGSVVNCMSFTLINIPPTVRAIKSKRGAFSARHKTRQDSRAATAKRIGECWQQ